MTKTKNITSILKSKKGEMYIDTAFKILIAVVVGALIFNAVFALFNSTVLERLQDKIDTLFATTASLEYSYDGSSPSNQYTYDALLSEGVKF